jgi:hypothetical protein
MRWRRPGRIVRRMTLLPAAALLLLAALLGACADEDNVKVKQIDCGPAEAQLGGMCGGAIVVATSYPPQGDHLGVHPVDFGPFNWGAPGGTTPNAADGVDGRNNFGTFSPVFPASWFCQQLADFGRADWYLPTTGEYLEVYNAGPGLVPGLQPTDYWSSRENNGSNGWALSMSTGTSTAIIKSAPNPVRCMRRLKVIGF